MLSSLADNAQTLQLAVINEPQQVETTHDRHHRVTLGEDQSRPRAARYSGLGWNLPLSG